MGILFELIIAVIVVALLWWALTMVLAALAVPALVQTLVTVLFVLGVAYYAWNRYGGSRIP